MTKIVPVLALPLVWTTLSLSCSNGGRDCSIEWHCTRGRPMPSIFWIGQSYPNCTEEAASQTIMLPIKRSSTRFKDLVTYNNTNVLFLTSESRIMSMRLLSLLGNLAHAYYSTYGTKLYVTKSWTEYPDEEVFKSSLHYEGRSVRIKVNEENASQLLVLAVEKGFDWVQYTSKEYVTLCSVTSDHSETWLETGTRVIRSLQNTAPVFDSNSYQSSVPENSTGPMFTVSAMDPDLGSNGELEYSLSVSESAPFSINSTTGQVSVDQPLDRETSDVHVLTITASDRGNPPLNDTIVAIVQVTDINDNSPQFTENEYEVSMTENEPPRALIQIRANDADSSQNGVVSYAIAGRENCMSSAPPSPCFFSIDADGIFETLVPLDFEEASQDMITVIATDNGLPPLSNTTMVTVNVENVDEFPPTFLGPCDVSLPETEETGVIVTSCPAEDFDDVQNLTSSNTIVYSITAGDQGNTFTVDENGTIRNSLPLDRENIAQHTLLLTVTDGAGLSCSMQVVINITTNDHAPDFASFTAPVVTIDEMFLNSFYSFIIQVTAVDEDDGTNGEISYSLLNTEQGLANQVTTLTVAATDGGNPSLSTNTTVTITFSTPCFVQQHTVESLTGVVSGLFLCSVDIQPPEQQVIINSTYSFTCTVLGNVPGAMVQLLHNNSFTGDEEMLSSEETSVTFERINAVFGDSGPYQCRVNTSIGSVLSNVSVVAVAATATTINAGFIVGITFGIVIVIAAVAITAVLVMFWFKRLLLKRKVMEATITNSVKKNFNVVRTKKCLPTGTNTAHSLQTSGSQESAVLSTT